MHFVFIVSHVVAYPDISKLSAAEPLSPHIKLFWKAKRGQEPVALLHSDLFQKNNIFYDNIPLTDEIPLSGALLRGILENMFIVIVC